MDSCGETVSEACFTFGRECQVVVGGSQQDDLFKREDDHLFDVRDLAWVFGIDKVGLLQSDLQLR